MKELGYNHDAILSLNTREYEYEKMEDINMMYNIRNYHYDENDSDITDINIGTIRVD